MSKIPVDAELLIELRDAANEALNRAERQYRIDHYAKLVAQADKLLASPQDSAGAVATVVAKLDKVSLIDAIVPVGTKLYTTPQPAGPAVEVAGEREAFEARFGGCLSMRKNQHGQYTNGTTIAFRAGWSEGAAWQRTQSAAAVTREQVEQFLAAYHAEVWAAAEDEDARVAYDEAGRQLAKEFLNRFGGDL